MENHMKKFLKPMLIAIAFVVFAMILASSFLYLKYIDKEHNLVLYTNEDHTQEVYILGTIHEYHFKPLLNYSYLDVQNVIDNTKPDLLLLEVDQEIYNDYGVIKSPVEMIPLWCYAKEQGINVKGVDWFKVTEESRSWTTNAERDDHIFENTMKSIGDEPVVLIILGATHRIEQAKRFERSGYQQQEIQNRTACFTSNSNHMFQYPASTVAELEKQIEYWNTIAPDKAIAATDEDSKGRSYWVNRYQELIVSLQEIKETIIVPNSLYKD